MIGHPAPRAEARHARQWPRVALLVAHARALADARVRRRLARLSPNVGHWRRLHAEALAAARSSRLALAQP